MLFLFLFEFLPDFLSFLSPFCTVGVKKVVVIRVYSLQILVKIYTNYGLLFMFTLLFLILFSDADKTDDTVAVLQ